MSFEVGQLVRLPAKVTEPLGWYDDVILGIVLRTDTASVYGHPHGEKGYWVYIPAYDRVYAFWPDDGLTCYPPTRAGGGRNV